MIRGDSPEQFWGAQAASLQLPASSLRAPEQKAVRGQDAPHTKSTSCETLIDSR